MMVSEWVSVMTGDEAHLNEAISTLQSQRSYEPHQDLPWEFIQI